MIVMEIGCQWILLKEKKYGDYDFISVLEKIIGEGFVRLNGFCSGAVFSLDKEQYQISKIYSSFKNNSENYQVHYDLFQLVAFTPGSRVLLDKIEKYCMDKNRETAELLLSEDMQMRFKNGHLFQLDSYDLRIIKPEDVYKKEKEADVILTEGDDYHIKDGVFLLHQKHLRFIDFDDIKVGDVIKASFLLDDFWDYRIISDFDPDLCASGVWLKIRDGDSGGCCIPKDCKKDGWVIERINPQIAQKLKDYYKRK